MDQKYTRVADGELIFDSAANGTLNERNIDEANAELAQMAAGCRRESEQYVDQDVRITKILAYIAIVIGGILTVISTVWTIVLDWGFFVLIIMSALLLLFGLFALPYIIKKQKNNAHIRDCGELYFAQTVKAPTPLLIVKLHCACVIDGKPRMLCYHTNSRTFMTLQKKDHFIIAYDKATDKFLSVRLFEKTAE